MVARFTGATLGLLAFTIAVVGGLLVQNPAVVILSRGILALFLFCVIGFIVGGVAQMVIAENEKDRESEIRKRSREDPVAKDGANPGADSPEKVQESAPVGGNSIAT